MLVEPAAQVHQIFQVPCGTHLRGVEKVQGETEKNTGAKEGKFVILTERVTEKV